MTKETLSYNGSVLEKMDPSPLDQRVYLPSKGKMTTQAALEQSKVDEVFDSVKVETKPIWGRSSQLHKYLLSQGLDPAPWWAPAGMIKTYYDPTLITEDFVFSYSSEGKGSYVTELPAGEKLGEQPVALKGSIIDPLSLEPADKILFESDVEYFKNKKLQSMKVPYSYYEVPYSYYVKHEDLYVKSKNKFLDESLGGFFRGRLSVVVGAAGQGKSSFALSLVREYSKDDSGVICAVVAHETYDQIKKQLVNDCNSQKTSGNNTWLMDGTIHGVDGYVSDIKHHLSIMDATPDVLVIDGFDMVSDDYEMKKNLLQQLVSLSYEYDMALIITVQASRRGDWSEDDAAIWRISDHFIVAMADKIIQVTKLDGVAVSEAKIIKDRNFVNLSKNRLLFHTESKTFIA